MSSLPLRAVAFIALSLMISACGGASRLAGGPGELGKPAPSLAIQSINGKGAVSLASVRATGKVTVVQFWATWCQACKKSLSDLEQLKAQSGGNVEAIGIAVDDTTRGVAEFAKAQGVSFPIAWDENKTLMWKWSVGTMKMPSTFVLDGKGNVRFVHETEKDKDASELVAREVAQLTSDAPASSPKVEVASAAAPAPAPPVAVAEAPAPAVEEPAPSEPAPAAKPKAKPAKKGGGKKAPKKNASR